MPHFYFVFLFIIFAYVNAPVWEPSMTTDKKVNFVLQEVLFSLALVFWLVEAAHQTRVCSADLFSFASNAQSNLLHAIQSLSANRIPALRSFSQWIWTSPVGFKTCPLSTSSFTLSARLTLKSFLQIFFARCRPVLFHKVLRFTRMAFNSFFLILKSVFDINIPFFGAELF